MKKIIEGSQAIAQTIQACKPDVVSAYPITPQTHIVEDLAQMKADGEDFEYVRAESEFAAISIVEGASMAGVRTYTASSSQGLLLMTEVLYNVAGSRLPVVLTCANRAVSAPINIWCFSKDADVLMADLTYRPINKIQLGDLVLGKDTRGNLVHTKVTRLYKRRVDEVVKIKTDNFDLVCTPDHRFYHHPSHGHWAKAKNLDGKELHYFGYGYEENKDFRRGWLAGVSDGDGCFYRQGNRLNFRLKARDVEMVDTFIRWSGDFNHPIRKVNYLEKEGYFIAILTKTPAAKLFKVFIEKELENKDYFRGYLAGMYDAEGTGPFKVKQAVIYGNDGTAISRVKKYLKILDMSFKAYVDKRSDNYHVKINNVPEFFIKCRPRIKRKRDNLLRMTLKSVKSRLKVLDVELINERTQVYNLETETHNYIVNGLLTHNCDQQDAVTMRDSGWIMWFGETNQEVCDLHILAYKVAEQLSLPVMVNVDGFVLTHTVEPVEIETRSKVAKFLPAYKPTEYLNINNPKSFGCFADPDHYFEIRKDLYDDLVASKKVIVREMKNFAKVFGRKLKLVEYYGNKNADTVIVTMGSVAGTIKDIVDELGGKIGLLKVVSLRPFPDVEIKKALSSVKNIAVLDKSISLGAEGILATEIRRVMGDKKKIVSFIAGLGGRDITKDSVKNIYQTVNKTKERVIFVEK